MADYQKMYVILCAAASDAADELADIPLAMRCWTVRVNKKYLGRKCSIS